MSSELIRYKGCEDAELGIGQVCGKEDVLVYDYDQLVACLMKNNGWGESGAEEWIEYNIIGGYLGDRNPIVLQQMDREALDDVIEQLGQEIM